MSATSIEWTHPPGYRGAVWNPTRGCSRVSRGCDHCYAISQAVRFDLPRLPYDGLTIVRDGRADWRGVARFVPTMLDLPIRTRAPTCFFVDSMSDLFHHTIADEEIAAVFGVMAAASRHRFVLLTKRPERMRDWFRWVSSSDGHRRRINDALRAVNEDAPVVFPTQRHSMVPNDPPWPLLNVVLGVSIEDQATADERIPPLLATPTACYVVSYEPALEAVDFTRWLPQDVCGGADCGGPRCRVCTRGIDWIIIGGESGPGARPFNLAWARAVVAQGKAANVPVFVKQLGARPIDDGYRLSFSDRKGSDPAEWPEDLRVREFPTTVRTRP